MKNWKQMNGLVIIAIMAGTICFSSPSFAAETSKKTEESAATEKSNDKEKKESASKAEGKEDERENLILAAVRSYIDGKTNDKEVFVIHDEKLKKDWNLQLDKIHDNNIVKLDDDRYFVCVDFKKVKSSWKDWFFSTTLDLDFYVKESNGGWKTEQVIIHKVDGEPRFLYDENNKRVPLEKDKKVKDKKGAKKET